MTTKVEKTVLVDVPVQVAYNQWTQFEEFPQFMGGVVEVEQLDDRRLHWVAEIAGVKRQWEAAILEQVPDTKVAWAATEGATNAGAVYFSAAGADRTSVTLALEYEPEGLVEAMGDKLNVVEKQVESDLQRFKELVERRGYDTGGWRGTVNEGGTGTTPGVEAAAATYGDKGKAGLSGKMKAAGAFAAAAAVIASGALKGAREGAANARRNRPTSRPAPPTPQVQPVPATQPVQPAQRTYTEPVVVDDVDTVEGRIRTSEDTLPTDDAPGSGRRPLPGGDAL